MNDASPEMMSLFSAALERVSPEERAAYLEKACGQDQKLRARLEGLLRAYEEAGSFLPEQGGIPAAQGTVALSTQESVGSMIGAYKLLEQIGEGGMGLVYVAEQQQPVRRKVALKLIKPGMDSRQVVARFEAERQALAMMDHPNIAKIYDGGTVGGTRDEGREASQEQTTSFSRPSPLNSRPYFVMELVKGTPITDYCDKYRLTVRQRVALFLDVCHAVQHAHQKGIIHRDIKPSNVMVTIHDVTPVVKVIDFGIAKATGGQLTDKTVYTAFAQLIGTPTYMSPEQAGLSSLDVDTRSDVYSLGVLLYELLTGTTPFDGEALKKAGFDEMRRVIREDEPPRPSARLSTMQQAALSTIAEQRGLEPRRISQHLRGELDWLVMKAMEKDRNRRYESASALAADVERYLHDEPVLACPPSVGYRLRKFTRRHKAGLLVASALLAVMAILTGSVGWIVRDRAVRQRELSVAVELALEDADRSVKARNWPQARAAAVRAHDLLASGTSNEKGMARADNLLEDLDMVARLEEIRLESATVKNDAFDDKGADASFAQAFRDYGIDVGAIPPDEAAARIREKPIAVDLIAALDAWATDRLSDVPRSKVLFGIAGQADSDGDPWRQRLRLALEEGDLQTIRGLAAEAEQQTLPPTTVVLLVRAIRPNEGAAHLGVLLLRKAQLQNPDDLWINHDLALHLLRFIKPPRLEEAVGFYRAALALRSQSPGIWLDLGNALREKGDLAGAIAADHKAIALKPDYAYAHNNLGVALREKGDLAGAIVSGQKAISLKPGDALAHRNLGDALREKGDFAGAIAAYQKSIALEPNFASAHYMLGQVLSDTGDLAGAIAVCQKAIALQPDDAGAHNSLGNVLRKNGDQAGAIAAYQKSIALEPEFAEAHYNLGIARMEKRDMAGAIAAYMQAIALKPEWAEAHVNLGNALRTKGDLAGALTTYRKAIALKPDLANAHNSLGATLYDIRDLPGALVEFRKTIALQPNDALAHSNLGNALRETGDFAGAIAAYGKAIGLKQDFAEAHNNLGGALYGNGDLPGGIAAYRKAIALKADYAEAYYNLGVILHDKGDSTGALSAFRKTIALNPNLAEAHYNLGATLKDKGDLAGAIAAYQKAIALKPDDALARKNLGIARREVELEKNLPAYLAGEAKPASADEQIELAVLCVRKQMNHASARFFEASFASNPVLAKDLAKGHRYNAACAAALAACGLGKDSAPIDQKERIRLRQQAGDWLGTDLGAWRERLKKEPAKARQDTVRTMDHWLADPDLSGVRDREALAKLPETERTQWQKLWQEIEALRDKAAAPK